MQRLPSYDIHGIVIISAYVMDLILGDPRWVPHPVRGIGWLIHVIERVLRRFAKTPQAEKIAGVLLVVLMLSLVVILSQALILFFFRLSVYTGVIVSVLIAFTTLAARGLGDAAKAVVRRLDEGNLDQARRALAMIVGRDTADLDEQEISRAVVETVAENASDGVVAPLFYLALGGPAFALAYKAVNTMDSMIGYKNQKYINFGWAAARLDDAANYIPARITAVLICLVSDMLRGYKSAAAFIARNVFLNSAFRTPHTGLHSPWGIMLRDGKKHPSPNSGYPEAAMAGALGIRLGGRSTYAGQPNFKPFLGEPRSRIGKKYIEKSVHFMYCVSFCAALGAAGILFLF